MIKSVDPRQFLSRQERKWENAEKTVISTYDFIALSNVNKKDEYLALRGVSFSSIIYSHIFNSSTAFWH